MINEQNLEGGLGDFEGQTPQIDLEQQAFGQRQEMMLDHELHESIDRDQAPQPDHDQYGVFGHSQTLPNNLEQQRVIGECQAMQPDHDQHRAIGRPAKKHIFIPKKVVQREDFAKVIPKVLLVIGFIVARTTDAQ